MSVKAQKCCRCGKRFRGQDNWNIDMIAGLEVGIICPACQTAEEHLGAEVNLATVDYSRGSTITMETGDDMQKLVYGLLQTYPDPGVMRAKADLLAHARRDQQASEMARLMRSLADDMESGEIYED